MREFPVAPGSLRVLIVDDEPSICSALSQVLRRAGYDAVVASGAEEADALLSETISAMLVDLRLPHMRGDVFFHYAASRFPHLRRRTLFMTGDITTDAERLVALTGCGALAKPFENAELVATLREMFGDRAPQSQSIPAG